MRQHTLELKYHLRGTIQTPIRDPSSFFNRKKGAIQIELKGATLPIGDFRKLVDVIKYPCGCPDGGRSVWLFVKKGGWY